jgi:hypothetical protein
MSTQAKHAKARLGADLVIPGLALGFAIYFFFAIADLAWEAKANGVLIGGILVVLVTIQIARIGAAVARGSANLGFESLLAPRSALVPRLGLVLLTIVFIAALPTLGLSLALFLAMAVALMLMGVRKPRRIFWVSFGVAAAAYLMFVAALDTDVPRGPVEQGIAAIVGAIRS